MYNIYAVQVVSEKKCQEVTRPAAEVVWVKRSCIYQQLERASLSPSSSPVSTGLSSSEPRCGSFHPGGNYLFISTPWCWCESADVVSWWHRKRYQNIWTTSRRGGRDASLRISRPTSGRSLHAALHVFFLLRSSMLISLLIFTCPDVEDIYVCRVRLISPGNPVTVSENGFLLGGKEGSIGVDVGGLVGVPAVWLHLSVVRRRWFIIPPRLSYA